MGLCKIFLNVSFLLVLKRFILGVYQKNGEEMISFYQVLCWLQVENP